MKAAQLDPGRPALQQTHGALHSLLLLLLLLLEP
jgi:hypothetical protein